MAQRLDLAQAWRRLSSREQEVLALNVFDGLSGKQAGSVLGITPVAYRLRLVRARRALRAQLGIAPSPLRTPSTVEIRP